MKCPWLFKTGSERCSAVEGLVFLTGRLNSCCENGTYPKCPVYRAKKRRSRLLKMEEFHSIASGQPGKHAVGA